MSPPSPAGPIGMALTLDVVEGSTARLDRAWTSTCDAPTDFSSIASAVSMIVFARFEGRTTVHVRGPETKASALSCPPDAEFLGADLRLGAHLPMFPPARVADLQDVVLPTLSDGRFLLDGSAWEMPTPQNVDVFVDRLARAGLLAFDPLAEELVYGDGSDDPVPDRTAQSRFVRAVGISRRKLRQIERARHACRLLRAGASISDVVSDAGYYDQPHLTRSLRQLIGYTPAEVARGGHFLNV
jgi:hypothetical protein